MPASIEDLFRDPIGSYPSATVAAFDATVGELPRRRLDSVRNRLFIDRLTSHQVPGILVGASTGHGHVRTVDELESWISDASNANWRSTMKMVLLRPEDGLSANERLIGVASDLDYRVIFVRPGRDLRSDASDDEVARNMQPIVSAASQRGLAVGVYSIPDVSGVRLTPNAARQLREAPGGNSIVAVKVTEADYESSTLAFLKDSALTGLKIVQGWDPYLAQALQDGPKHSRDGRQRCGVTSGPMSFALFQYLHILDRAASGDWTEVAAAQQAVTLLFASMQDDPRKFADLQRAKFVMGLGHPLLGEVKREQVERLILALETLPRIADRMRLAESLNLLGDGPLATQLQKWSESA